MGKGGGASWHSKNPCSRKTLAEHVFLTGTAAHGEPKLERIIPEGHARAGEKCERSGRVELLDTDHTLCLMHSGSDRGIRSEELKLSLGKDERKVF